MLNIAFTSFHCFLIRNGFGLYVVSFISMLSYQAMKRQLSINAIEFIGHGVLMLLMGRLVLLVTEASTATIVYSNNDSIGEKSSLPDPSLTNYIFGSNSAPEIDGFDPVSSHSPASVSSEGAPLLGLDYITIGLLFCFASNIASFLFGISLGRQMDKTDGKSDAEPKKRWLDRRFVIKPKAVLAKAPSDNSTSLATTIPTTVSPSMRNGNAIKLYTQRSKGSTADRDQMGPMEITIEKSKQTILSILNLTDNPRYKDLPLHEIRNSTHSNGLTAKLFTTTEKTQGIYLTGSCHTYLSPEAVLSWLKQNSFTTGFEGLAPDMEVNLEQKSKKAENTVRRLVSKPASMMSSKRDFIVVTSISKLEEAGAYLIASRSMPDDFENLRNGTGLKKKGGFLRGIVYGSGWILHPWATGDGDEYGCEISFATHIDMMGAASSNVNQNKQEILADRILSILSMLCSTEDVSVLKLKPESGGIGTDTPNNQRKKSHSILAEQEQELVDDGLNSAITAENKTTLLSVAKTALEKLKRLHSTYRPTAQEKESWDVFYEQSGVTVRELKNNSNSTPVGILSASCTTEAPPHVVRQLLMNHPKEVDALLEGRTILSKLDHQSYIQWLAYGTIWPIGARDFLLVTTEDVYDERTGDGFVIASTSIDHLCELEGEVVKSEADDSTEPSYTRSSLKLAGYVGVPNAQGGTDVSLFVDVDVYFYIPAWLLQVLAQYGLSEMMNRIQRATMGHPQLSFRNDITRMLSRIESTEAKMRSYVQDNNLPVPKDASFLFSDGSQETTHRMTMGNAGSPGSPVHTPPRRTLSRAGDIRHLPVPTVEEAAHRRASVRRMSVISNALPAQDGGIYQEYYERTRALAAESKYLMRVYLGIEEQKQGDVPLALDWQQKKKEKSTTVFGTPVAGNTWNAVRAVGVIRADKADILKLLIDDKRIGEFDDMFDSCSFLYKVDDVISMRRMAFKAIWPTAPREFLVCSVYEELPDGTIMVCTRSPEPEVGEDILSLAEGYVRGRLQISGYYIQPYATLQQPGDVPEDGCRITLTAHSELGGTLPSSVINMLSTAAPLKILQQIAKILEKKK